MRLLQRDPAARPTAAEALQVPYCQHASPRSLTPCGCEDPWLAEGNSMCPKLEGVSNSLSTSVVQRLQRYNNYSRFKRVALERVMHAMVEDPRRPQILREIEASRLCLTARSHAHFRMTFSPDLDTVLENGQAE